MASSRARAAITPFLIGTLVSGLAAPPLPLARVPSRTSTRHAGATMDLEAYAGLHPDFRDRHYAGASQRSSTGLVRSTRPPAVMAMRSLEELRDEIALASALQQHGLSVILFGARWCSACRSLQPRIRRIATIRPELRFFSVTYRRELDGVFAQHQVTELPSIRVFDTGKLLEGLTLSSLHEVRLFESRLDHIAGDRGGLTWGA